MKNLLKSKRSNSHLHFNINNKLLKCKSSNSHFRFQYKSNNLLNLKRSQTAIEFVILVGFVLFFFTVFSLVIQGNMSDKLREKKNLAIKEIALTVQDEINLALESSDGYSREFKIPKNLNGQNYEITINEQMVYIHTPDNKYAMALPVGNVTGNIQIDINKIRKENGKVYLNA